MGIYMVQNEILIPDAIIDNFNTYARKNKSSVERLWLITFQTFLHRLTQEDRILVAASIQVDKSWKVFSAKFNTSITFSELLKQETMLAIKEVPAQITFQYQDSINICPPESITPILKLELGQTATWNFDPTNYTSDEIDCIPKIFIHFAENLSINFDQICGQISLLSREQWAEMESWNRTEADFPSEACLHEQISAQASHAPERIAAAYNGQQLSFGELEQLSNRLAHALIAAGIRPGHVVGLYIERNLNMPVAQLAVLKTGAAYAALDLQYPPKMLAQIFDNFDLPYILTHSELIKKLPEHTSHLLLVDQLLNQKNLPLTAPKAEVNSCSAAFIIFTSGSTGVPKGVIHTHRNLLARFHSTSALIGMNKEDAFSQSSPLSSIDSVDEIYLPLLHGARTVIVPHKTIINPRLMVDLLEEEKVTRILLVPLLLQVILTAYEDLDRRLVRLKTWLVGGEALIPVLIKQFYEKLPQAKLINFYGLTEGDATYWPATISVTSPSIGRPIQNRRVYVLDSQLQPVPPGLPGEICLSGEGLFKEYWNRPDLNSEKWRENPYSDSPPGPFTRLFKTGDVGRWLPDGQLQFLGRRDRMVKIRGYRVELDEIEATLRSHPYVRECAVRVWQRDPNNNSAIHQPLIVAYVVLNDSAQTTTTELRNGLKEQLPDYSLPKQIILLNSLPLLTNGKINYRSLPEPSSEYELESSENFNEPNDELELFLVKLWERILNRHPIGTRDNFFDLGGDSLHIILMTTELEQELNQTLSLSMLFHAPTIVQLSSALRQKGWKPAWSSLVPIQPHGSKPPLFCVHADGGAFFYNRFTSYISPEQPLYGIQARGLDGKETPFRTIKEMAQHYIHEIRSVQPKGPYIIGGFSMGGVVIYEMAQQLKHAGEGPVLVVFLDAASPKYPEMMEDQNKGLSNKLKEFLALPLNKQLDRLITRSTKRWREMQDEIQSKLYLLFRQPLPPALRIHTVRKINQHIADIYEPLPYSGNITVLRASEQMLGAKPDRTLGWGHYVTGIISDYVIPGNHVSVSEEPNVRFLAEQLQKCIDNWLAEQQAI
jgi:amino acid adenylation domain-containing protein